MNQFVNQSAGREAAASPPLMQGNWPRLRARRDWRGVLQPGRLLWLRSLVWAVTLVALMVLQGYPRKFLAHWAGLPGDGPLNMITLTVGVAMLLAVYAGAVHYGEQRRVDELAPRRLIVEVGAGFAGAAVLFSFVIALLIAFNCYRFDGFTGFEPPWTAIKFAVGPGVIEELLFRGILMRLIWEAFGLMPALVVSSAAFGLAHIFNPNANIVSAVAIMVEAGLMLGALYAASGRLWLSIGAHAGWNFTQGYVFGANVSGQDTGGHLFHVTAQPGVSDLLTGGGFGPEASIPGALVATAAGVLLLWFVWDRHFKARVVLA